MKILVTGGAGYIGSHTCVELLNNGYDVIVVDNLCNSCEESIRRVEKITQKEIKFIKADLCEPSAINYIFDTFIDIDTVIHFAGLKAVGESVREPLKYYKNNIVGTINLIESMYNHRVNNIIFSSSATVYGVPKTLPIKENFSTGNITNPYGATKLYIEKILTDFCYANPNIKAVILRYFNPIGAHESGLIGESPNGIPNNLLPYIAQVAIGKLEKVHIFGDTYPTKDGTGVRDYIHVVDLAKGHLAALNNINKLNGVSVFNLGTGQGYSVLEVLHAYEKVCGKKLPYVIDSCRSGDVAECYADPSKALRELGWKASLGIDEMCSSSWKWQILNPDGYGKQY